MASNVRFLDQVPVSAYSSENTAISTGSFMITGSSVGNVLTFTKGDNSTFQIAVAATGSSADSLITASISGQTLTFTKGDLSTFTVTVPTGSEGGTTDTGSLLTTASIAGQVLTFTKGDGSTFTVTVPSSGGGGIFEQSGSSGVFTTTSSLQVTGSILGVSPFTTTGDSITQSNAGTGGGAQKYALIASQSVWHYSDNVGIPTSKAWKSDLDGSYFNNFDHNTDTAEIVRFMAGLLSASAPDASPNTKTFSSISEDIDNNGTGTAPAGRMPQNSTNTALIYLKSKNFTDDGQVVFSGLTVNNNSNYHISYDSVAGGSTSVSSSADAQLFGLGAINAQLDVSGSSDFKFENNNTGISTATSHSSEILSRTGAGTSNGLTVGNISTGNALIPDAFQDGKFVNIFQSGLFNNGVDFTTTGSVGFYEISASITLQTGSGGFLPVKTAVERIFYAPISNLNTLIPANSISINNPFSESFSATSRSLSGAPYLITNNYRFSSSISNLFNPMYAAGTVARVTETDSLVTLSNPANGASSVSVSGGTIDTANTIFTSAGVARSTGEIPNETDIVRITASIAFSASNSGATNIQQTGLGTTSFTLTSRVTNKNSSETSPRTDSFNYFDAGAYGQPVASGSMAYYGRAQGYDGGSLTGTSENFTGENFRLKIDNNILIGTFDSGTKFTTSSFDVSALAKYELQVKPGHLVFPGGTHAYWLANPDTSTDYKYYARAFKTDGNTKTQLTLSVGQALVKWSETTNNSVAAAVMFQSAATGIDTGGGALARPVIYDFATLSGTGNIATNQVNDNQLNPFSSNIDIGKNVQAGSGLSGTTYTMPLTDTLNQVLNSTYTNFIILLRYKGSPTPVSNITITY
jgi:hypothetical protein|tara:strand:+ start:800 stop:3394 length:2595 start_codon:yes stop_codon:yes gene_type:complete